MDESVSVYRLPKTQSVHTFDRSELSQLKGQSPRRDLAPRPAQQLRCSHWPCPDQPLPSCFENVSENVSCPTRIFLVEKRVEETV